MPHRRDPVLPEHPAQLLLLELLADPIGKQIRTASLHEPPRLVENLQRTTTQRYPVLPGLAGTVHTPSAREISVHSAQRTSPHRTAVSTRNWNASRTADGTVEPRAVRIAAATLRCGNARMCCTTSCCGPRTEPIRSHGVSMRNSIATAHSSTARMRWRSHRAVSPSCARWKRGSGVRRRSWPPRPALSRCAGRRSAPRSISTPGRTAESASRPASVPRPRRLRGPIPIHQVGHERIKHLRHAANRSNPEVERSPR